VARLTRENLLIGTRGLRLVEDAEALELVLADIRRRGQRERVDRMVGDRFMQANDDPDNQVAGEALARYWSRFCVPDEAAGPAQRGPI
jgi:hypothetical protein